LKGIPLNSPYPEAEVTALSLNPHRVVEVRVVDLF